METMTVKANELPIECPECKGKMFLWGVMTEQSQPDVTQEYWECESCQHKHEISERVRELEAEMENMEFVYSDFFPEPSEQLDRYNKLYEEYRQLRYPHYGK